MRVAAELGSAESAPASPCIGVCLINPATRRCRGCLRTIAEIANWYEASAVEKRVILAQIATRLATEGTG